MKKKCFIIIKKNNMNYINLPPGRNRGLAYSIYISGRRRTQTIRHIDSYLLLSNLLDIKVGVTFKNLKKNSSIKLYNKLECKLCVICQNDIINNDIIRTLNCSHQYHINCIDTWFLENRKCPVCRFEI